MYVNDLPSNLSSMTAFGLYADDVECFRTVHSMADGLSLQEELGCSLDQTIKLGFGFNMRICQVISKAGMVNFVIFTIIYDVEGVNSVNDGLNIELNMCWNKHADQIISNANRSWYTVRQVTRSCQDVNILKMMYANVVRSELEYCRVAWD